MIASQNCFNLIKASESLRLTPYNDGAGFATIGWGHKIQPQESFANITLQQANDMLSADTINAQNCVNRLVKVTINQNQFDALVDFVFNLGCYAFLGSALLKLINESDFENAANEFDEWIYSKGKVMPGLVIRRQKEKELFLCSTK